MREPLTGPKTRLYILSGHNPGLANITPYWIQRGCNYDDCDFQRRYECNHNWRQAFTWQEQEAINRLVNEARSSS